VKQRFNRAATERKPGRAEAQLPSPNRLRKGALSTNAAQFPRVCRLPEHTLKWGTKSKDGGGPYLGAMPSLSKVAK
jgi:hypothetical protein